MLSGAVYVPPCASWLLLATRSPPIPRVIRRLIYSHLNVYDRQVVEWAHFSHRIPRCSDAFVDYCASNGYVDLLLWAYSQCEECTDETYAGQQFNRQLNTTTKRDRDVLHWLRLNNAAPFDWYDVTSEVCDWLRWLQSVESVPPPRKRRGPKRIQ